MTCTILFRLTWENVGSYSPVFTELFSLIIAKSLLAVVLLFNCSCLNEHYINLFTLVPVHFPLIQCIIFLIIKS